MNQSVAMWTAPNKDQQLALQLLLVAVAVGLTVSLFANQMVLTIFLGAVALVLATVRFQPLLLAVVFFLPVTLFLSWDLPIRDLATLVRLCLFAGMVIHHLVSKQSIRKWLFSGRLSLAILGYLAIAVLSALVFNKLTVDAERELMRLASYVCLYYAIAGWVKTEEDFRGLLITFMLSTIVVCLFGFYQVMIGDYSALHEALYPVQDEVLKIPPWSGRITSFLGHYNSLAGYLNLVIPFCIGLALNKSGSLLQHLGRWCFVLSSAALVLTQSRGGLLAYVAILILAAFLFATSRRARILWMTAISVLSAGAAVFAAQIFERLSGIDEFTAVSRFTIWAGSFASFVSSPIVGMGYGNLRAFLSSFLDMPEGSMVDAHNLYLELLAETGIVGLIVYILLAFTTLRMALRQRRMAHDPLDQIIGFGVCAGIFGVLVHGSFDYMFHTSPQFAACFFTSLGLLAANEKRREGLSAEKSSAAHG